MNSALLDPDVQDYIDRHLKSDPTALVLKGIPFAKVSVQEVVEQIESKNKCEKKLPTWFNQPDIYYPNKLNIEQTSSEKTAAYKSQLINGNSLIDLTGGFGVDTFYFAKSFKQVTYCEVNSELSQIVEHNFKRLNAKNIIVKAEDGLQVLQDTTESYDWIYLDPSRRHDSKGKVFFLNDCLPNVPKHLHLLFAHAKNILIKTSPLLDLSIGIKELEHVKTIHVVAVNNEVKELLWILHDGYSGEVTIKTVNIKMNGQEHFEFVMDNESEVGADYTAPRTYLYEPNPAIMKSGGFNSLATALGLGKLHKHSHLYTSDEWIEFPGRAFKLQSAIPYNKKQIKALNIQKANITTRNFPETVQNIRKAFKIKDGGEQYLFFTTTLTNEKIVLVGSKA